MPGELGVHVVFRCGSSHSERRDGNGAQSEIEFFDTICKLLSVFGKDQRAECKRIVIDFQGAAAVCQRFGRT